MSTSLRNAAVTSSPGVRNGTMTKFSPVIDRNSVAARWLVDPTVVVPTFSVPGFGAGGGEHVGQGAMAGGVAGREDVGEGADPRHRHKVVDRIIGQAFQKRNADRGRARQHHERYSRQAATISVVVTAVIPPARGWLSMMTAMPSRAPSLSARIRSVTSDTEPAANGSMTRIGRDGNGWALAVMTFATKAAATIAPQGKTAASPSSPSFRFWF